MPTTPAPAPTPQSPLATAAGGSTDPWTDLVNSATGGTPNTPGTGSYVGQQSGGVTANNDIGSYILGNSGVQVTPALQGVLADSDSTKAVVDAQSQYEQQLALYNRLQTDPALLGQIQQKIIALQQTDPQQAAIFMQKFADASKNKPQPPDLLAIQKQADRGRLLSEANSTYLPLIKSQLQQAMGTGGPSAAQATYQGAADNAQNRIMGLAASARGTGGQRAATFQSALAQVAQGQQGAANDAAKIRAQEQQQAGTALNSSLQGLTQIYGNQNLMGDTTSTEKSNQDAQNAAILANARAKQQDSSNISGTVKTGLSTLGAAATA